MRKYLGIIGDPISHSLSPLIQQTALKAQGLDYLYLPFRVLKEDLEIALEGINALNFVGINVTLPHKTSILNLLDEVSAEARLIGAVNTVVFKDGKSLGYNTDGQGFLRSLLEEGKIDPLQKKVLILGSGGAARAVAVTLALQGVKDLVIVNRTMEKAKNLVSELAEKISGVNYRSMAFLPALLAEEISKVDLIINATSIGLKTSQFPVKSEWFNSRQMVVDLVYYPLQTSFLQKAARGGAQTLTGAGMLVYQGVEAYRLWTGMKPPVELMYQVLLDYLHNHRV